VALGGFGDAFAGRGASINEAIAGLNPFFRFLTPVMRNLADPRTQLNEFFKQIGAASAQVAPVARVQVQQFIDQATTFAAIVRCPSCLQATIEKSPPTEDVSIRSFRVQQPFLANFTDLSKRLQPATRVLPTALPKLNRALAVGTPVVRSSKTLNDETAKVFNALDDLVQNPNTLLALRDGRDAISVLRPFVNYVAPYQTVCNYGNYFFTGLSGDVGFTTANGSAQAALQKDDTASPQDNKLGDMGDRPADVPSNVNPQGAMYPGPGGVPTAPWEKQQAPAYPVAIDAQGNADCEMGQYGYSVGPNNGPVTRGNFDDTYKPHSISSATDFNAAQQFDANFAGGSHTSNANNLPGLRGPTFTGVQHLKDVP
jgi:hypothetical protein